MKNVQTPAEQLRAWRAYCRLTTTQLSQCTGIPEATLNAIEEGRIYPDVQLADRLNQFFSQYPAQMQTQQYMGVSQPGPGSPNYGTSQAVSYPGVFQPRVPSYPGATTQYTQSYPGMQQSTPSYPGTTQQTYAVAQPVTQQVVYSNPVVPASVQQSQYYLQPNQTTGYLGLTAPGAVFLLLFFIVPIVFMFFPFMDLLTGVAIAGITVDSAISKSVTGVSALAYTYYEFSFTALATQVALWMTLVGALAMIVLCILRIFGFDLFAARTLFFYLYLIGVIVCFIGLCVTTLDEATRWAYIAYALSTVVAVVFRITLDGGMRSFVIVR